MVHRRRRKYQGATWTPINKMAQVPDGVWCKSCKTRHGYMTMGFAVEQRKIMGEPRWVILWSCRKTGNVIEEMVLGGHRETGPEVQ